MNERSTRHDLPSLNATVVCTKATEHYVEFKVYDIEGIEEKPVPGRVLWVRGDDYTDDIAEADVLIEGEVKWDGCSNWRIGTPDGLMLHECDRLSLARYSTILMWCWDEAFRVMEREAP